MHASNSASHQTTAVAPHEDDRLSDTLRSLRKLINGRNLSVPLEQLVAHWVARRQPAQLLLEHLRVLLLRGDIGLIWTAEGTQVRLGVAAVNLHYRRCRKECLSEGEMAEFASAVRKAPRRPVNPVS